MSRPVAAIILAVLAPFARGETVDYSREVLPILSANCFVCHGRDPSTRTAELRLDVRDEATKEREEAITPIVPGRPQDSALIARVTSTDPDVRMPPPEHGNRLSQQQIELIQRWIGEGAKYSEHWAFAPATRPAVPDVKDGKWPAGAIDRFVLARLENDKLKPAPRATREALIRRATLDLVGLPPTAEDVLTFVNDDSPDAYDKLIERLLASPHYGERYGRHWLDVARYADSGGFETDIFFGHAWRYRDYVIRSLNADKPFDRFIKEQIAGDELWPDNEQARLATGLYTTGPVLQEAGMVAGKLEYDQLTDAVDTTGAAFLGMTLACARCHDHKYDPVSQKEYYGLQAVFAASDQVDFAADWTKLRERAALKNTQKEFESEQARSRVQRESDPVKRAALLRKTGDAFIEADQELKRRVDATQRYNVVKAAVDQYAMVAASGKPMEGGSDPLAADPDDNNDQIALKAVLTGIRNEIHKPQDAALLKVGIIAYMNPAPRARDGGGGRRRDRDRNPAATRELGSSQQEEAASRPANPRRAFMALQTDEQKRDFLLELGRQQLAIEKPDGYIEDIDALRHELGQKHLNDPSPIPYRVLAHRDKPIEVKLLERGELDRPGEIIGPGLPEQLAAGFGFASSDPARRRAALAEWIASGRNLFTARVIANRVWQWHFGEGIVRTPNDFGVTADRPSHPELLDWLAVELVEKGWSLKHLHRLIMKSSAYQMSCTADATTLERDPDNRLLTRYQPRRLEAEAIWDSLRAASGVLDLTMYGLPVAPPLDAQEQLGNYRKWPASTPEEANRRAIYILVKRSFRFPMLSAFDLPDNIASCGRRDITTVPNQGLTLLNNSTMRKHAEAFADRLLRDAGNDLDAILDRAWLHAYSRRISEEERQQATSFIRQRSNGGSELRSALAELCLAVFNTNEFIYIQ
jgi:hypothetical protein